MIMIAFAQINGAAAGESSADNRAYFRPRSRPDAGHPRYPPTRIHWFYWFSAQESGPAAEGWRRRRAIALGPLCD